MKIRIILLTLLFTGSLAFSQRYYFSTEPFKFGEEPSAPTTQTSFTNENSIYGLIVFDGGFADHGHEAGRKYLDWNEIQHESRVNVKPSYITKYAAPYTIEKGNKVFMYIDILPDPAKTSYAGKGFENFWTSKYIKPGKTYKVKLFNNGKTQYGDKDFKYKTSIEINYIAKMEYSDITSRFSYAKEKGADFFWVEHMRLADVNDLKVGPAKIYEENKTLTLTDPNFKIEYIERHLEKYLGKGVEIKRYSNGRYNKEWSTVKDKHGRIMYLESPELMLIWNYDKDKTAGKPWCWTHMFYLRSEHLGGGKYGAAYIVPYHPNIAKKRCNCSLVK